MIDIFDDRKRDSLGFFHYVFWIIGFIMFSTCLISLFMKDFNLPVSKAQWELTAICTGMGLGILIYRVLVMAVNDIWATQTHQKE